MFLLLFLFPFGLRSQLLNKEVEAKIQITPLEEQVYKVSFLAYNKTELDRSLEFTGKIIKKNMGDLEGEPLEDYSLFVLKSLEQKQVVEETFRAAKGQRVIVFMLIKENGSVIGKDRIVINGFEGEDQLKPMVLRNPEAIKPEGSKAEKPQMAQDVPVLRGMVTEDTKTKPGRDFYQYFFMEYNAQGINGDQIVKVTEELAIGGNTQIKIYAGNSLVAQFFINPRATYLKEMTQQSVGRLLRYFRSQSAIQQNTIQY